MDSKGSAPMGLSSLSDIVAFERTPLDARDLPATSYAALAQAAQAVPHAPALSFFAEAEAFDTPFQWDHETFFDHVTRTANALRQIGVGRDDVVAYVLPNLPEAHLTIWGGSAAGRVLAINPMIEAMQMAELMRAASVRVLVTTDRSSQSDIWEKASAASRDLPSLRHILVCAEQSYAANDGVWLTTDAQPPMSDDAKQIGADRFWDLLKTARADALEFGAPRLSPRPVHCAQGSVNHDSVSL
ncbi:AMP-binding protein [Roseibium sp. RKSG952]|uniref:AMP-binding protein n=1 Tax=Roseibium sp. RKSG952 TaxID=2529384 RepID=UPI0018AD12F9|nr:AMP-binding protein [Roseibium sp. RKSG952]